MATWKHRTLVVPSERQDRSSGSTRPHRVPAHSLRTARRQRKETILLVTNCQVKRNFIPKKISDGLFQPKTLRGRLFNVSMN